MPSGENNDLSPVVDEVFYSIVEKVHASGQEWTEEELSEFELQLYEWAKRLEWARQYLDNHPSEDCIDEKFSFECETIEFVQREVMLFLERAKNETPGNDLDNIEEKEPLREMVYVIISGYYPNTTREVFLREIENAKAKKEETILKKATKRVIAEAATKTFQEGIKECCQGGYDIENLCLLVQALMESGLDYEAIGKILGKTDDATRKFKERCKKHMREHEERYWQTIEQQNQE